ncbi:Diacylglycerol lipase-alpha [Linum perenne]
MMGKEATRDEEIQLRLEIWKLESALAASSKSSIPLLSHKFVPSKFVEKLTFSPIINQQLGFMKLEKGASKMRALRLEKLRRTTIFLGLSNLTLIFVGGLMVAIVFQHCDRNEVLIPIYLVSLASISKIFTMVFTAIAQEATAKIIMESRTDIDSVNRVQKRVRYKRWLWWSRLAMVVTVLQLLTAFFLLFNTMHYISHNQPTTQCVLDKIKSRWEENLLITFTIIGICVPIVQLLVGPDVLRWRSFYETQDEVWEAHYKEVFDYGIREALCCLGRFKYLSVYEEDEIHSVAKLLGNLVAYRASGTGHLELLAGLALLQRNYESPRYEEQPEAPTKYFEEAFSLHEFTEAAYTGPLLDFGRNAILFPCTWLYRQGIFTPWTRNSRPILDGDNWWRGHAAAFVKYVNLPPHALRRGRVCQEKCEAAYFILVVQESKTVVVAVRGTETPEDLITDGLGRVCPLSRADLEGLLKHQNVELSFPHYAHLGIVEATRDLYMQVEGNLMHQNKSKSSGFLSSLLGEGCECEGYTLRIVGHSLGGAIASMLGLRLKHKFPNLHVYAYGPLPCVDSVIADACSGFITSIVHENEFSTRLSVGSIMRLRADAVMALSQHSKPDSTLIFKLARRFLLMNKCQKRMIMDDVKHPNSTLKDSNGIPSQEYEKYKKEHINWDEPNIENDIIEGSNHQMITMNTVDDTISQLLAMTPSSDGDSTTETDKQDVFVPGRIIHLVSQLKNDGKVWNIVQRTHDYKAYLAKREQFIDIVVSPYMFIDHLPWRCHHALKMILESRKGETMGQVDVPNHVL